jgi:hypothetical protein
MDLPCEAFNERTLQSVKINSLRTTRRIASHLLHARTLVALLVLAASGAACRLQAADPYDASLEQRVEALEKELNIMEGDSKGKNVDVTNTPPTFLSAAGSNVQQLTISGDLRFRYNYDNENFQYPGAGNDLQRSRYLFRLRLNLNYTLSDNFFAAVGVATNGQSDSQNEPISEGFDDYGIYLHQFIVGWKATDYATVIVGKLFAPFYDNEDVIVDWSDINPTGVTEKFTYPITNTLNIAANFGQYIFYDNPESGYAVTPISLTTSTGSTVTENVYSTNPAATIPQNRKEDAILSYNDVVLSYKPAEPITLTLSPGFYCYLLHGSVGLGGNAVGPSGRSTPNDVNTKNPLQPGQGGLLNNDAFNSDEATDDLYIAMFNGDVKFPIGPFKGKFYWDFAYNVTGSERSHHIYDIQEASFADSTTWLAGVQLGELKRKGDWYVSASYRQNGVSSIDPNLNDDNFALSRLNVQGIRIDLGYNVTSWLKAEVWYYGAWNLEKNIHTLTGVQETNGTINEVYDGNAIQNFIVQMTASF